jgi:hypothetical protein
MSRYLGDPDVKVIKVIDRRDRAFGLVLSDDGFYIAEVRRSGSSWDLVDAVPGPEGTLPPAGGSRDYLITPLVGEHGEIVVGGFVDPEIDRVVARSADGVQEASLGAGGDVLVEFRDGGELRLVDDGCVASAGSVVPSDAPSGGWELPSDLEATVASFLRLIRSGSLGEADSLTAFPDARLAEGLSQLIDEQEIEWGGAGRVVTGNSVDLVMPNARLSVAAADIDSATRIVAYTYVNGC